MGGRYKRADHRRVGYYCLTNDELAGRGEACMSDIFAWERALAAQLPPNSQTV